MLRYGLTSAANLSRRLALAPTSSALVPRAGHAQVAFKSSKALEEEDSLKSTSGSKNNSGKQQESKKELPSFLGTVGGSSSSNSSSGGGTDALKAFFEKRRATLEREKEKAQLQKSEQPQPPNQRQQPQSNNAGRGQGNRPARSNNTAGSPNDFTALRNALSRKPQPKQQQQQPGSQQRQSQPQQQQQQGSQQRPQQSQINRNNNSNPQQQQQQQQQQQRPSRPLPNANTTNNNIRGRPNQQSSERNNGGNQNNRQEIPRLADLMKHLRPDALSEQTREQNNNRRDSMQRQEQPQWRQRRQQQQQQQQQQRPGQDSMEQRQFQQRPSSFSQRGPRQPFQRQKNDDFLQGRTARADEFDAASTSKKEDETRTITLPLDDMTLTEMSILYRIKVDDIKRKLKSMGERVNDEYMLDVDMAELLAMEYGLETVRSNPRTVMNAEEILLQRRAGAEEVESSSSSSSSTEVEKPSFDSLPPRPPVVCIMGHVDHGKTTLMDALRRRSLQQQGGGDGKVKKQKGGATAAKSKDMAGTEAGGITQIISAFQVALEGQDSAITFLDTPGHAAFSAMRQSGSHAADVIVLVVAADDGVSEQTIEIINFYKSIVQGAGDSGISMIIALNKIDKPGLDVDQAKTRIENQLLEHGIITEGLNYSGSEYGLPVTVVPTSGLTGQGLDELMESLFLQSEIMDLRADDKARAEGIVLDARLEKGLGVVVDCIVRWGSIKKGDVVVSGTQFGKVRMLKDGE